MPTLLKIASPARIRNRARPVDPNRHYHNFRDRPQGTTDTIVQWFKSSSIDQLSNLPASQESTLNFPGPEKISQIKKSTYRTSGR